MQFRSAVPDDLAWMTALAGRIDDFFFAERLPRALHDPGCRVFVAEKGGRPAAFAELEFPWPGHAWLQWMRVDPECQGAGLGTMFTRFLTERARAFGACSVGLTTMEGNVRVHRIADRLGFVHRLTEWSSEEPNIPVPPGGSERPRAIDPGQLPGLIGAVAAQGGRSIVRHPGIEECFTDSRLLCWNDLAATGRVWGVERKGALAAGALVYPYYRKRWTTFISPLFGEREALMPLINLGFQLHGLRNSRRVTLSLPVSLFGELSPGELGLNHGVRVYHKEF